MQTVCEAQRAPGIPGPTEEFEKLTPSEEEAPRPLPSMECYLCDVEDSINLLPIILSFFSPAEITVPYYEILLTQLQHINVNAFCKMCLIHILVPGTLPSGYVEQRSTMRIILSSTLPQTLAFTIFPSTSRWLKSMIACVNVLDIIDADNNFIIEDVLFSALKAENDIVEKEIKKKKKKKKKKQYRNIKVIVQTGKNSHIRRDEVAYKLKDDIETNPGYDSDLSEPDEWIQNYLATDEMFNNEIAMRDFTIPREVLIPKPISIDPSFHLELKFLCYKHISDIQLERANAIDCFNTCLDWERERSLSLNTPAKIFNFGRRNRRRRNRKRKKLFQDPQDSEGDLSPQESFDLDKTDFVEYFAENEDCCSCFWCIYTKNFDNLVFLDILKPKQERDLKILSKVRFLRTRVHGKRIDFYNLLETLLTDIIPQGNTGILSSIINYLYGSGEARIDANLNVANMTPDQILEFARSANINIDFANMSTDEVKECVSKISNPTVNLNFGLMDLMKDFLSSDFVGWLSNPQNFDFLLTVLFAKLAIIRYYYPSTSLTGLCGIVGIFLLYRSTNYIVKEKVMSWVSDLIVPKADSDVDDTIDTVMQALSYCIFGKFLNVDSIQGFGEGMVKLNKFTKNFTEFMKNLKEFIINAIKMIATYWSKDISATFSKLDPQLKKVNDLSFELIAEMKKGSIVEESFYDRADDLLRQLREIEKTLRYSKEHAYVHNYYRALKARADIIQHFVNKYRSTDLKLEPAIITIVGAPGVGKTTTAPDLGDQMLCQFLTDAELVDYKLHPGKHTYSHMLGSEYFDGYDGQRIICLNDFLMNTEAEGKPTETAFLIQAKGTNKHILNCASLDNKFQKECLCWLLIVNTNARKLDKNKLKSLTFVGALARRLNEHCFLQYVKPQYRLNNTCPDDWTNPGGLDPTDNKYYGRVDPAKASAFEFIATDDNGNQITEYRNDIYLYDEYDIEKGDLKPHGRRAIDHTAMRTASREYFAKQRSSARACQKFRVQNLNETVDAEFTARRVRREREKVQQHNNESQAHRAAFNRPRPVHIPTGPNIPTEYIAAYADSVDYSSESNVGLLTWLRRYIFFCLEAIDRVPLDPTDTGVPYVDPLGRERVKYPPTVGYYKEDSLHWINTKVQKINLSTLCYVAGVEGLHSYDTTASFIGKERFDDDQLADFLQSYRLGVKIPFTDLEIFEALLDYSLFSSLQLDKDKGLVELDPLAWYQKHPIVGSLIVGSYAYIAYRVFRLVYNMVSKLITTIVGYFMPPEPKEIIPITPLDIIEKVIAAGDSRDIEQAQYHTSMLYNMYNMWVRRRVGETWSKRRPASFVGICGRSGLTVHHLWQTAKDFVSNGFQTEIGLSSYYNLSYEAIKWVPFNEIIADESHIKQDLVKLTFPSHINSFPNIGVDYGRRKCQFPKLSNAAFKDWISKRRSCRQYVARSLDGDHYMMSAIDSNVELWMDGKTDSYTFTTTIDLQVIGDPVTYNISEVFITDKPPWNGDCGSMYWIMDQGITKFSSSQPVLQNAVPFCMLTGGLNEKRSLAVPLTHELINDWFQTSLISNDSDPVSSILNINSIVHEVFDVQSKSCCIDRVVESRLDLPKWQTVLAEMPPVSSFQKSCYDHDTPFYKIFPIKHKPSKLRPFYVDDVKIDPMVLARYDYGRPRVNHAVPVLPFKIVSEEFFDMIFRKSVFPIPPLTLTFSQAVVGDIEFGIKPLPKDTSPGFYMGNIKKIIDPKSTGKQFLFGPGIVDVTDPNFLKCEVAVNKILDLLVDDGLPSRQVNLNICNLKDELLPLEKVKEGRTRLFQAGDGFFVIIDKMLFGSVYSWVVKNAVDNWLGIGIDGHLDFDQLYRCLSSVGTKAIAGDYKRFDKSFLVVLFDCVFDFIRRFYGPLDKLNNARRESRFSDIINGIHLYNGPWDKQVLQQFATKPDFLGEEFPCTYNESIIDIDPVWNKRMLVSWPFGLDSGLFLTALIGSLGNGINTIATLVALKMGGSPTFFSHFDEIRPATRHVLKNSYFCFQGDDHVGTITNSLAEVVNFEAMVPIMADFGMTYQSCKKDGVIDFKWQSLIGEECVTFLKRYFSKMNRNGSDFMVGVLDKSSIEKPFNWNKKEYNWQIRHDMAQNAIIESSGWEKPYFNYILSSLFTIFNEYAPIEYKTFMYTDYETCRRQFTATPLQISYVPFYRHYENETVSPKSSSTDVTTESISNEPHASQVCTDATTTCFVESDAKVSSNLPEVIPATINPDTATSIEMFLRKPYSLTVPLSPYTYGTSSTGTIFSLDISSYLATSYITNKLQGYGMISAVAHVFFELTYNPFMSGMLIAHIMPNYADQVVESATYVDRINYTLLQKFQHPHEVAIIPEDETLEITFPYISPTSHYDIKAGGVDWGRVELFPVAPLEVGANATSTQVVITPWIWFTNVKLRQPIYPQSSNFDFIVPMGKEGNSTFISDGLSKVSKVASSLESVPQLAAYAGPVAWITRTAAGIASAFGFSRPEVEKTLDPMFVQMMRYSANSTGSSPAVQLGLIHDNRVVPDLSRRLRTEDEMSFEFLRSLWVPAYDTTNSRYIEPWTTSNIYDDVLSAYSIGPNFNQFTNSIVQGGSTLTYAVGHPIYHLGRVFQYYTGDMEVYIRFLATNFHKGKVSITFTAGTNVSTLPTTQESILSRKIIVSIGEQKVVKMVLPYELFTPMTLSTNYIGKLQIRVLVPLVAPETVSSTIQFIVFFRAGSNFQFAAPGVSGTSPILVTPQSDVRDVVDGGVIGGGSTVAKSVSILSNCVGEAFTSIKQLLSRPSACVANVTAFSTAVELAIDPWYCGGITLVSGPTYTSAPLYGDMVSFFSSWYLYAQGGMRFTFKCLNAAGSSFSYSAATLPGGLNFQGMTTSGTTNQAIILGPSVPNATNITNYLTQLCGGCGVFIGEAVNNTCELCVPYYCNCPVAFPHYYDGTTFYTTHAAYAYNNVLQIYTSPTPVNRFLFRSGADDYVLSNFMTTTPTLVSAV